MLAAGTLTGVFSTPHIARADSTTSPDPTANTAAGSSAAGNSTVNAASPRLPQNALRQENGQGPRVSILQPSYSDLVRGETGVVIAVEAKGAPTKSVQLFVDGVSASDGGAIPFENLPTARFNWKTAQFKDGKHLLTVRVTDADGFIGQADTQVYVNNSRTADTTAPKLQWKNVHNGDLLHGQANLELKASDTFGVKYIVITINSISSPDRMPPLRASLINREPYVYSLDTTRLPDGVYVLKARGHDVLQNQGETREVTFGVSNNGLNPTVVERLDEVLKKQPEFDKDLKASAADKIASRNKLNATKIESSAGTMVARTRHDARVTPARTFTKAAPLVTKPAKITVATRTKPKAMVVAPTVKKSVSKPARVAAAITNSQPVEAAALILPHPSLTVAPDQKSAEPTLHDTSDANAMKTPASQVHLRVTAPFAGAQTTTISGEVAVALSTRLAAAPKPATATNPSPLAVPSTATMTAVTTTPTAARIARDLPAMQPASADVPSTRIVLPNGQAAVTTATKVATVAPKTVSEISPVVQPQIVESRSATRKAEIRKAEIREATSAPELRKTRDVPGVRPSRRLSSPELRKSRSLPGVSPVRAEAEKQENVQADSLDLKPMPFWAQTPRASTNVVASTSKVDVEKPQRVAMLPRSENKSRPQMTTRSVEVAAPESFQTERNATIRAVQSAQAQVHMTATVLAETDSRIAQSGVFVMQPRRKRDERSVRRLISLPSNLGTPSARNNAASRPTAPITMSPVTIAALGARGAAGTLPSLHVVARGETLRTVAERYGLPIRTLASVNNLSQKAVLTTGKKLNLPRALNFRFGDRDESKDIGAIMVGQSSVAPFRFLFEQQGGTIKWDAAHQRITAINGAQQVTLSIGSREATINDRKVMMDLAAFLLSGRTMVPIRFFEKALQAQVQWEPSTGRI
ncbi:MAG TPA: stalk domain-containing protein, partial [Abditibacteriaceae bacterium]|nr:stalk domain-containing protein [Abditibacteriaceae bacterium]